ncbi:MAG TPA: hypothetical protein VFJ82_10980 [Longimicrobium sp.]|nr:hypothetical protein [Longimicrobium sp.]
MSSLVKAAADAFQPWADLYGDSSLVKASVVFLHLGGLLVAGGFALAADRATLGLGRLGPEQRLEVVHELGETHRPVLAGLAVVIVSGVAMLAADLETLLPSVVFWAKMGGFALLLLNGLTLQRAERRLRGGDPGRQAWRSLHRAALRSAVLWFAVLFLGALLASS